MDLIYTDKNRVDKGVLISYTLDLDVAGDKDFELVTYDFPMEVGDYWYIDGTEYGGVVDGFSRDPGSETTTYYGRNFRGILNSKIVEGDNRSVVGEITDVINTLIVECNLQDMFVCDDADGDEIEHDVSMAIASYSPLYDVMVSIARSIEHNFTYRYNLQDKKIHITPALGTDLSDYLNYCNENSLRFTVESRKGVNHLIIIGFDQNDIRKQIHLFTDENGGVQPYTLVDIPIEDKDYILDKSRQLLFGIHENQAVVNVDKVSPNINYTLLEKPPTDWSENCTAYYEEEFDEDEDGRNDVSYKSVAFNVSDYTVLASKPADWDQNYGKYFIYDSAEQGHVNVSAITIEGEPIKVTSEPGYWRSVYKDHLLYTSDGINETYESYTEATGNKYQNQTITPSDWTKNFSSYYMKKDKKYVTVVGSGKKKNIAPTWRKNKYYTQCSVERVPPFVKGRTYRENISVQAPSWEANKYYIKAQSKTAPNFASGKYFRAALDYYHSMVEKGKEFLRGSSATDKQEVSLEGFDANIGDTVGGIDDRTGIAVCEKVTNMIIKIDGGVKTIEYVIGGENQ